MQAKLKGISGDKFEAAIDKLEPERRALPLLLLEQFDDFFVENGYSGRYKKHIWSNAHYFIYTGQGKLNHGYEVSIKFYWNEISFKFTRAIPRWRKWLGFIYLFLSVSLTITFAAFYLVLLFFSDSGTNLGGIGNCSASYKKRRRMVARRQNGGRAKKVEKVTDSFILHRVVRKISPGIMLPKSYGPETMEQVIKKNKTFIEKYLVPNIRGEQWMEWLNK